MDCSLFTFDFLYIVSGGILENIWPRSIYIYLPMIWKQQGMFAVVQLLLVCFDLFWLSLFLLKRALFSSCLLHSCRQVFGKFSIFTNSVTNVTHSSQFVLIIGVIYFHLPVQMLLNSNRYIFYQQKRLTIKISMYLLGQTLFAMNWAMLAVVID